MRVGVEGTKRGGQPWVLEVGGWGLQTKGDCNMTDLKDV